MRRWAWKQAFFYVALGGGGAWLSLSGEGVGRWLFGALSAFLLGLSLTRWWRLRTIAAGTATVILEGEWLTATRNRPTRLGRELVDGVVAPGVQPELRAHARARAVALDRLSWFLVNQSYTIVEWLRLK